MNNNFDTGLLNKYLELKNNEDENIAIFDSNLYRVKSEENRNKSKKKIKGGYINIDKARLKTILYEYHRENCGRLIESIKEALRDNSEFEINEDEIDRFLFDNFLNKLTLLDFDFNIYNYNIIHKDVVTEENFNEISEDLLEENENTELRRDFTLNMHTIEEIYDKFMVYNAPNSDVYNAYINNILDRIKENFDNSVYRKICKLLC